VWSNASLPPLSGHSFRIGGTTRMLLLGIDPFIIMAQGHWKSTAFLEYWRLCEEIIPTFISFFFTVSIVIDFDNGLICHNSFPKLSPNQPPPPFGRVYTTDLAQNPTGYIDQCRPYLTGPLGPISVAFQPMAKTPVRSGPAGLRDGRAFQDHMAIM